MRILIGYNGSEAARASLYDLRHAGLSDETVVLVLTVSEAWPEVKDMAGAERTSSEGAAILREEFPQWTVTSMTSAGSPPREILACAESYKPDLIVVGEPRRDLSERKIFVGNTSHTLLTEAQCSVRIARGNPEDSPHPERIMVGFDGSAGSARAVAAIAGRRWNEGADVRLLSVADSSVLGAIGRFTPQMTDSTVETRYASKWAETLAAGSKQDLARAGISSSVELRLGHPKDVIINEAAEWGADTIFVGPHCSSDSFERFLLGSVSSAVAARAHCSVEIIRK